MVAVSTGRRSISPWRNSTLSKPCSRASCCPLATMSSVISTPMTRAAFPNLFCRQKGVDAGPGSQVQDRLAFLKLSQGRRIAAAHPQDGLSGTRAKSSGL
jgi:hypothetical protein